ncbi:TonB-dependent receptor [Verrucomicrobiales bacterium]|nr:TonB-dependent receptor [Verrucomicrobiales bacterium]
MPDSPVISTRDKALQTNLDQRRYGTFAEIGAGQEVARWFFRVGGAAGTIAKSISAYDMQVSDAIYGKTPRYVCRERLEDMLDYEQNLNIERLTTGRGDTTAFFAFANTVSARNYKGTNECHGWMGVKFQAHPGDESSQIIIHVRMWDKTNELQQEALGIVGVNLVYGSCFLHHDTDRLVESLVDGLTTKRIEIDMIEFNGIEFRNVDNRLKSLQLVELGLTDAAMFSPQGEMLQPSAALRKRPILVERGTFNPVTDTNIDILECAAKQFCSEESVDGEKVIEIMEITMHDLTRDGKLDHRDFLARADLIAAAGKTVLISNYFEYFRLAAYFNRYTDQKIGLTLGAGSLLELFDEKYYTELDGGILEAFGRLFKNDLTCYVYPAKDEESGKLTTTRNIRVASELKNLYKYLLERGGIVPIVDYDERCLDIHSGRVLELIKKEDASWETMVPKAVVKVIKDRCYFGFCELEEA